MSKEQTAEEITPVQTEQLNQIVSRTDVSGNEKVKMIKQFVLEYATLKLQEQAKEIEMLKGEVNYEFTYKDENGKIMSKIIKISEPNAELAISKFEKENPNIVWREFKLIKIHDEKSNDWIDIKKRKPIATERGEWDGLKSSPFLVMDNTDNYHIVIMYEGKMDGSEFCNFYDKNDFEIKNIVKWKPIN
jgi:hypothetical protein